tara:strand:+ start:245 stop:424 length:180 start_codon:yes stop_codon:yes gene_type:complete
MDVRASPLLYVNCSLTSHCSEKNEQDNTFTISDLLGIGFILAAQREFIHPFIHRNITGR